MQTKSRVTPWENVVCSMFLQPAFIVRNSCRGQPHTDRDRCAGPIFKETRHNYIKKNKKIIALNWKTWFILVCSKENFFQYYVLRKIHQILVSLLQSICIVHHSINVFKNAAKQSQENKNLLKVKSIKSQLNVNTHSYSEWWVMYFSLGDI